MIEYHTHDSVNSPPINIKDLEGVDERYIVKLTVDSGTSPAYSADEGTMVATSNGSTYRVFVMINGGWRQIYSN